MAAITRVRARPCSPVGYEVNDRVVLADDVVAGDLLTYTGAVTNGLAVMGLAAADAEDVHAIALKNGYDGQEGFDVGIQGEMDGFSGMTPGDLLFPSATVAGGLDDAATTAATPNIRAVSATRIRYNFI
jgi:hypothetical protein